MRLQLFAVAGDHPAIPVEAFLARTFERAGAVVYAPEPGNGVGDPVDVARRAVADARGLELVQDDGALEAAVDKVIEANPDVADKIRGGKVQAAGALIGQVMKEMKGQADAGKARELILAKLGA